MSNTAQPKDKNTPNFESPRPSQTDTNIVNKNIKEYGGPKGKEPTRYGDWEKKGRCIDF